MSIAPSPVQPTGLGRIFGRRTLLLGAAGAFLLGLDPRVARADTPTYSYALGYSGGYR